MKNFWFGKFLRFVLIIYIFCVCWIFLFLLKWGWLYNMYKGETVLVEVKAPCISHCNSILIWSDFIQKSFYTFKIRYLHRRKLYQEKKIFKFNFVRQYFDFIVGSRGRRGGYVIHSSIALHQGRQNRWARGTMLPPRILTDHSTRRGRLCPSQ